MTCIFCGLTADVELTKHSGETVCVCRICVPRNMVLDWADNTKSRPLRETFRQGLPYWRMRFRKRVPQPELRA